MKSLYNYYLVFRTCWLVLLFHCIGFFALVKFAQGQDILREMSLHQGDHNIIRQSWLMWITAIWWGWQSYRAARIQLHLSYFNFWNWSPGYALGSQVLVPRLLATVPLFIISYALYKAKGNFDPQIALYLSSALWLYIFLHYRRELVVWLRSKRPVLRNFIPDYTPIKNGSYPVKFVFKKQSLWLVLRLMITSATFVLVISEPVYLSRFAGSAAMIMWAFGTWLVLAGVFIMLGKLVRLPVFPTLLVWAIVFSYFNNNHKLRTRKLSAQPRPDLETYFKTWMQSHDPSKPIYLVATEGGGIRAAYWSSSILTGIQERNPEFKDQIFCLTGVSGGSLGNALSVGLLYQDETKYPRKIAQKILSDDFLSPVTSWLVFPDILQKFLPFPVPSFDRARALEYSWEQSWENKIHHSGDADFLRQGFLEQLDLNRHRLPVVIFNSTLAEKGNRAFISNIRTDSTVFYDGTDVFDVLQRDLPISTAIGASARFPFITPPATLLDAKGNVKGNLLDGGYYENTGVSTILEVYYKMREIMAKESYHAEIRILLLRNTMPIEKEEAIRGLSEVTAPLSAFENIWYKSGTFGIINTEKFILEPGDRIETIRLQRDEQVNLPLGWYLSSAARAMINEHVDAVLDERAGKIVD